MTTTGPKLQDLNKCKGHLIALNVLQKNHSVEYDYDFASRRTNQRVWMKMFNFSNLNRV